MNRADVVIAGGGVVGCAIALALAREGCTVALLERDTIGAHASRVAAGMLTPLVGGDFAHAAASGAQAPLGGDFAHAAAPGDASEPAPLPLGRESLAGFPAWVAELRERTGIDPGLVASGVLRVARDAGEAEVLRARAAAGACDGLTWLDADAARAREPGLAPAIAGALWSPREGSVGAERLTAACAQAARALGVRLEEATPVTALCREGERVVGVRTPRGDWSAAWVVLATGAWAGADAAALGLAERPPVEPVRGQIVALRPERPVLGAIAWDAHVYLVPRPDGRVLAGATEEFVGFACHTTEAGVRGLVDAAVALVPALAGAPLDAALAGLRPGSPDGLPLIGPAPGAPGLLLAVGHHRHGILLAPATGRLVADLVAGRALPPAAAAFAPARFATGRA